MLQPEEDKAMRQDKENLQTFTNLLVNADENHIQSLIDLGQEAIKSGLFTAADLVNKSSELGRKVSKSLVQPAVNYTALIAEAGIQGAKFLADPLFRKAINDPESLTQNEIKKLNQKRDFHFVSPELLKNRKTIAQTGAKRIAGAEAYPLTAMAPGASSLLSAIGLGAVGGAAGGFARDEKNLVNAGDITGGALLGGALGGAGYGLNKLLALRGNAGPRTENLTTQASLNDQKYFGAISQRGVKSFSGDSPMVDAVSPQQLQLNQTPISDNMANVQVFQQQTQGVVNELVKQVQSGQTTLDNLINLVENGKLNQDVFQRVSEQIQGLNLLTQFNQLVGAGKYNEAGGVLRNALLQPETSPIKEFVPHMINKLKGTGSWGALNMGKVIMSQ